MALTSDNNLLYVSNSMHSCTKADSHHSKLQPTVLCNNLLKANVFSSSCKLGPVVNPQTCLVQSSSPCMNYSTVKHTLSLLSLAVAFSWSRTHLRASSFLQMLGRSRGRPFSLAHSCNGPPSAASNHKHNVSLAWVHSLSGMLFCHSVSDLWQTDKEATW